MATETTAPARLSKGERTRQRILEQSAAVFNARGYQATSMADLVAATGLEKGGIYNHFGSKEDLALAAYEHNVSVLAARVRDAVLPLTDSVERILAVIDVYRRFTHEPPFPGGCPTLNTAIESHGSDPRLHEQAQAVMQRLLSSTARMVQRAIADGSLRADVDPEQLATVIVTSIEGGLLLAEMYHDPSHMDRVAAHLRDHVLSLRAEGDSR
ncbi:MAG TPA: TetR/AcrR family transcriptional regulator [Acidimicrobiia bacterium]|nr:TetR/AcrR family transcriptional regulator [Acidimicrobiia bacterium]